MASITQIEAALPLALKVAPWAALDESDLMRAACGCSLCLTHIAATMVIAVTNAGFRIVEADTKEGVRRE